MAAGSIVVDLLMRTGSFETDTKRAQQSMKRFEKSVDEAAQKIKIGLAAAGAAMTALVYKTTQTAEEIQRFARLTNTSAESFQMLAAGASTVGIQTDKLADIFKDVQDKVGDFVQTGGGALADFFENIAPKIGVTVDQFRRLSGAEALQLYVSSLEKANLSQADMIFYLEAIASDSSLLLPLLQNNGQAMAALGEQAKATGQIMSDELIQNSIEFRRQMDQLTGILKGFGNAIVQELLPSLIQMSVEFRVGMEMANGLFDALAKFGTINPFRTNVENLKVYREELVKLEQFRQQQLERGGIFGSTAAVDSDINDLKAKIAYLEELERRLYKNRIVDTGAPSDPRAGRGYVAPVAPPATVTRKQIDEAKKAADEYAAWMRTMQEGENQYQIQLVGKRLDAEKQAQEEYQAWMDEMRNGELEQYLRMQDLKDARLREATEKLKSFADQMGMAFGNAFENAIVTGQKLSDVLGDLANDLLRLVTRQLVTAPLANAISGAISGAFGGPRATGGPVTAGTTYLVGERGPELFTASTSGKIIPNNALGGSGVAVNVINNSGVQATTQESTDSRGQRRIDVVIGELAGSEMRRGGSSINMALRQTFGVAPTLAGR